MTKQLLAVLAFLSLFLGTAEAVSAQGRQEPDTYSVNRGDNLWEISLRYKVRLSDIIKANPQIKDPHWVYPGEQITVPLRMLSMNIMPIGNEVVRLVNQERANAGLNPLTMNWELSRVAFFKAEDMRDRAYFAHNSPIYGSPFDMIRAFRIGYSAAGENIAAGQASAQDVMNAWMNSPAHRQNILSPNYSQIGIGYCEGGSMRYYWSQMFINP
ncbi:LysM peptidoglycan-binding domain-containing protein [Paenibacillus sp. sptzw28]|uniref:CAP domain-containing protein n=1 Tax=Paenibacillus sp. sptzw28 TaxID=715179 RepID=UPI001C6ED181|nr:CAP domain-containing protein [Paenibacillus sp. sptzw28]QYR19462.1 LysM peptidoglycan-binding domain-containing protein [Paenibacillus sp. sptzw28]